MSEDAEVDDVVREGNDDAGGDQLLPASPSVAPLRLAPCLPAPGAVALLTEDPHGVRTYLALEDILNQVNNQGNPLRLFLRPADPTALHAAIPSPQLLQLKVAAAGKGASWAQAGDLLYTTALSSGAQSFINPLVLVRRGNIPVPAALPDDPSGVGAHDWPTQLDPAGCLTGTEPPRVLAAICHSGTRDYYPLSELHNTLGASGGAGSFYLILALDGSCLGPIFHLAIQKTTDGQTEVLYALHQGGPSASMPLGALRTPSYSSSAPACCPAIGAAASSSLQPVAPLSAAARRNQARAIGAALALENDRFLSRKGYLMQQLRLETQGAVAQEYAERRRMQTLRDRQKVSASALPAESEASTASPVADPVHVAAKAAEEEYDESSEASYDSAGEDEGCMETEEEISVAAARALAARTVAANQLSLTDAFNMLAMLDSTAAEPQGAAAPEPAQVCPATAADGDAEGPEGEGEDEGEDDGYGDYGAGAAGSGFDGAREEDGGTETEDDAAVAPLALDAPTPPPRAAVTRYRRFD